MVELVLDFLLSLGRFACILGYRAPIFALLHGPFIHPQQPRPNVQTRVVSFFNVWYSVTLYGRPSGCSRSLNHTLGTLV